MPVAQTTSLPQIAFSRNPILVTLQSNDYIATPGVNAVILIKFSAAPIAVGQLIHLNWFNAPALILSVVADPDGSGTQIPAGDGSSAAYVNSLIDYLDSNYYINRDFTIEAVTVAGVYCLQLTAIASGVVFNIGPSNDMLVNVVSTTSGVDQVMQSNFAHHLEVWMSQNGSFNKIYDNNIQLDFPVTGLSTKDISAILNPYLSFPTVSDKPLYNAVDWQLCANTTAQYFIKFGQYYGDTPTVKKVTTSANFFVTYGGLAVQAALNQTLPGFIRPGNVDPNVLCLRQGSKLKNIQINQPEWLYWLNLTGADITISLQISAHCTDGTLIGFTYANQLATAYNKYYIAVGYSQINIPANVSGKTCDYYTARVVSAAGNFLSAEYTYVVDQYREFPRYFVYLNSLGGYQTLYTWGKGQLETDRTKDDLVRQVLYPDIAATGKAGEANIRIQDKVTVNTGYTTIRDVAMLKDFMASTEKYWYSNGVMIPIGISSDSIKQPSDGENMQTAQFEFFPLYDEFVYTDNPDQADMPNTSAGVIGTPVGYNAIIDDGNNNFNNFYQSI
ncbi:hypothetical protein [Mucilaginibacter sp.]